MIPATEITEDTEMARLRNIDACYWEARADLRYLFVLPL
jgi:hypothetical protein